MSFHKPVGDVMDTTLMFFYSQWSGWADTPSQRATLWNTRPECGLRALGGRVQEGRLGHCNCLIRWRRDLNVGDWEKIEGRDEYLRLRNYNESSLYWHILLFKKTKPVSHQLIRSLVHVTGLLLLLLLCKICSPCSPFPAKQMAESLRGRKCFR